MTGQFFTLEGYQLNGPLHDGSVLTVCYKNDLSTYVLKGLTPGEARRVQEFNAALPPRHDEFATPHAHIIAYRLWKDVGKDKDFMLMPRLLTTLEPVQELGQPETTALWSQMQSALSFLHGMGFAHGDVKPANICVKRPGPQAEFVLIDLGSIRRFGNPVQFTPAYLPIEMAQTGRVFSSESVDWWMLAMTIMAEKCCGSNSLQISTLTRSPKKAMLVNLLERFVLDRAILSELRKHVGTGEVF